MEPEDLQAKIGKYSDNAMLVIKFEFLDHGLEHPDFFQGCGVSLTKYDLCFTGIGATPYEAGHEALELASHDHHWNDAVMADAETWIEGNLAKDLQAFAIPEDSDATYHVSIRIGWIT